MGISLIFTYAWLKKNPRVSNSECEVKDWSDWQSFEFWSTSNSVKGQHRREGRMIGGLTSGAAIPTASLRNSFMCPAAVFL